VQPVQIAATVSNARPDENANYSRLVERIRGVNTWPLYTTDAADLYACFLEHLPAGRRQHYACRTCRRFVDQYGGLVAIGAYGDLTSPLWHQYEAPGFFEDAVQALANKVSKARVTGVFYSGETVWGRDSNASPKSPTGAWHHMHIQPSFNMVHRGAIKTADQVIAEKREEHHMLARSLADYPIEIVQQAHTLLTTDALYRSEKCIGVATWLLELHTTLAATKNTRLRDNFIWRAIASAPPGFAHVRSTMIGTLLDDLVASKPFAEIKRSFDAKMAPLEYRRPKAAPTDGQLAAAEAVVAKLNAAGALARRYATLEEVVGHALWVPKQPSAPAPSGGVFDHLRSTARASETIDVPAQVITWDKFNWTVLPKAERIELLVPIVSQGFFAFVTATNPEAPPILQWDHEAKRNPVSWYVYPHGSRAAAWNLTVGEFRDVAAIMPSPTKWTGGTAEHLGDGAYFIVPGARDIMPGNVGVGLFPEILKAEFHGIRAAMEAYSQSQKISGGESATACGVALQKGGTWSQVVRVTVAGARILYRLDRWD